MTTTRTPTSTPAGELPYLVLCSLYQHRAATSGQLHQLLAPLRHKTFLQRKLRWLRGQGLIDSITLAQPRTASLWFLTEEGRALTASLPEMSDRDSPPQNFGTVQARLQLSHTQAVLETHLAFLAEARRRGDEYGPLDWSPEVYHRLSERRKDALRADALMRYTSSTTAGRVHLRAFVELDRCTMSSEKLTSKLTAYARFYELAPVPHRLRGTTEAQGAPPAWHDFYPMFPRLLFVLTGGSETTMRNRIEDLQLAAGDNARVLSMLRRIPAGAATLQDIAEHGPSAPVWSTLADPDRPACGWTEL